MITVEIKFAGVNSRQPMFDVYDYNGNLLADQQTVWGIIQNTEWIIGTCWHPLNSELPKDGGTVDGLREMINALERMDTSLYTLRNEQSITTSRERYSDLTSPTGPIRRIERQMKAMSLAVHISMQINFGLTPDKLADLVRA